VTLSGGGKTRILVLETGDFTKVSRGEGGEVRGRVVTHKCAKCYTCIFA
jgi:hypothetical protein